MPPAMESNSAIVSLKQAKLRFYAELNDFLPPDRRFRQTAYNFLLPHPVKDAIEGFGVPHTEVELILVNAVSVGFEHVVEDGDQISVYPLFESIDIGPLLRVRPAPLRAPKFVLDVHLGRLAAFLRMAGLDAVYRQDATDPELTEISRLERRILLTRDAGLLKRSAVTHGYFIRATQPREQLPEVLRRFDLCSRINPFSRCIRCNNLLEAVHESAVRQLVPPAVFRRHKEFRRCQNCGKVYWQGSHYERMCRLLEQATRAPLPSGATPESAPSGTPGANSV